jgi:hypothetical protein
MKSGIRVAGGALMSGLHLSSLRVHPRDRFLSALNDAAQMKLSAPQDFRSSLAAQLFKQVNTSPYVLFCSSLKLAFVSLGLKQLRQATVR